MALFARVGQVLARKNNRFEDCVVGYINVILRTSCVNRVGVIKKMNFFISGGFRKKVGIRDSSRSSPDARPTIGGLEK